MADTGQGAGSPPGRIRAILDRANGGDESAWHDLFDIVFEEWHALARGKLRREAARHTLETSALVNEAWMRVQKQGKLEFDNTRHLHGAVNIAMDRILIDRAKRRGAKKHGGEHQRVELDEGSPREGDSTDPAVIDLASALEEFRDLDPRAASVVIFRHCYGYTNDEVAAIFGVTSRTIRTDASVATAWLRRRLSSESAE